MPWDAVETRIWGYMLDPDLAIVPPKTGWKRQDIWNRIWESIQDRIEHHIENSDEEKSA